MGEREGDKEEGAEVLSQNTATGTGVFRRSLKGEEKQGRTTAEVDRSRKRREGDGRYGGRKRD